MVLWMIDAAVNAASTLMDGKKKQKKMWLLCIGWVSRLVLLVGRAAKRELLQLVARRIFTRKRHAVLDVRFFLFKAPLSGNFKSSP